MRQVSLADSRLNADDGLIIFVETYLQKQTIVILEPLSNFGPWSKVDWLYLLKRGNHYLLNIFKKHEN